MPELPKLPLALLQLVADGKLHSGEELAVVLGVSRTTIWKQLTKLKDVGLEFQSQPGVGYCLIGGIELLNKNDIYAALKESSGEHISSLEILDVVDSTNAYLLRQSPAKKIAICLAEFQTAGRGRRGRVWVSPFAKNIYLSLRFTVDGGISSLEGLSLAVGVVVASALASLGLEGIQLKWPNDVLWKNKKLGGVLIEVVGDPAGVCHVVVGVGLNVSRSLMAENSIDQPWATLEDMLFDQRRGELGRNHIASVVIRELVHLIAHYESLGFTGYREKWMRLDAYANREVDVHVGAKIVNGIARGVNQLGALVLQTDQGEQVFYGGEVSMRGIHYDT
jgi:BirA family transcriptional regulator, biotin operon repressor / biotin---[acetyl-CoA-carboxylase] ligase